MILSDDRQKYFMHLLIDGLWGDEIIDFDEDAEEMVIREAKRLAADWVGEQGDVDVAVRQTLSNLKRELHEGTPEWKVLYKKYFADEMARRGHR